MVQLSQNLLKVEIVDCQVNGTGIEDNDYEMRMKLETRDYEKPDKRTEHKQVRSQDRFGIRATFAEGYSSRFGVRMKVAMHGRICGEKIIENNRIHDTEGHTVFNITEANDPNRDLCFSNIEQTRTSGMTPSSGQHDPSLVGTMVVTFEDIMNVRYYSTPREQTYRRYETIACKAERKIGSNPLAHRIPLERLVNCGMASISWDYVHEDRHPFAHYHFRDRSLGQAIRMDPVRE